MRSTKAFLIGVGAAYLLDPRAGRRRRHVLRNRTLKAVRRSRRVGLRKARFASGRLQGVVAWLRRPFVARPVPVDDATVRQRIRSDALRDVGVSTTELEVEVEDGVATLRGAVDSRKLADELVARVAKVPGVRDVAAMLRVAADDVAG